jgi:hypothetical protein
MLLACAAFLVRIPLNYGSTSGARLLYPAEIIDLLKCFIIGSCCYAMSYVDTSMLYHMIKSQSVIKLYLMYNMIEVADRLFSAFGRAGSVLSAHCTPCPQVRTRSTRSSGRPRSRVGRRGITSASSRTSSSPPDTSSSTPCSSCCRWGWSTALHNTLHNTAQCTLRPQH